MNFLAHLYLSGSDPMVKVGNFIGDHVKGNAYQNYEIGIQQGILLHRKIDFFTDTHPLVKRSALLLNERYGRYSGIVMDVFFDFFLAQNWDTYSPLPLTDFVTQTHRLLMRHYFKLPNGIKSILPFIIKSRRLETYATFVGIERSLEIMSNYSSLPNEAPWAMEQLQRHHQLLHHNFTLFFDELQEMVNHELA